MPAAASRPVIAARKPTASSAECTLSVIMRLGKVADSPAAAGFLLEQDQRLAFALAEDHDRVDAGWTWRAGRQRGEDEDAGHQFRRHRAEQLFQVGFAGHRSGRLRGHAGELRHDHGRAGQALFGVRPVAHEDDALVRPDLGQRALLADVAHQARPDRRTRLLAEMDDDALRTGVELLDIGLAAERLDEDDLQQVLRPRPAAGRSGRSARRRRRRSPRSSRGRRGGGRAPGAAAGRAHSLPGSSRRCRR